MYITNNPSAGVVHTVNDNLECPACESICKTEWTGQINILGLIFALTCIFLYIFRRKNFPLFFNRRKKKTAKRMKIIFWIFFVLSVFYILNISYQGAGEDCVIKGCLFEFKFWPKGIIPWF